MEILLLLVPVAVIALAALPLSERLALRLAIGGISLLVLIILLAYQWFPHPGQSASGVGANASHNNSATR